MQEKEQKISPIKQRILQFADYLGISKRDFYKAIGVSRGTLESKTGITEDIMAKFIATYPDVSIKWLITGHGSMLIPPGLMDDVEIAAQDEEVRQGKVIETITYRSDPKDLAAIQDKIMIIEFQTAEIKRLKSELAQHAKVLDNAPAAATPAVGATQPSIEHPLRK